MKKIMLCVSVLSIICFLPILSFTQNSDKVIAYYFHGNFRCPACYRIEQYSREAIESNFKEELKSGKLVFKVINVEKRGNQHFIKDYQLYTKSLVISLVKDGKEIKYKNLTKVWEYLRNKQKFYNYVKDEIEKFLGEL